VSFICVLVTLEAISARCFGSSSCANCIDCGLKLVSLVFFAVIVLISVIVAAELAACIVVSVFCKDVDENSLSYIQMAVGGNKTDPYSDAYNASRYYIRGDMYNPILGYAESADQFITQIVELYKDFRYELKVVGMMCPDINDINLETIGLEAEGILDKSREVLKGTNIYPYYSGIVRQGACNRFMASLGWIILFQTTTGLVCFPVCILMVHRYLVHFAAWKRFEDEEEESSSSEEEEGEDGEDRSNTEEDVETNGVAKPWAP